MRKLDALDVAATALRQRLDTSASPTKSATTTSSTTTGGQAIGQAIDEVAATFGVDASSKAEMTARALALTLDPKAIAASLQATAQALGKTPAELKQLVGDRLERLAQKPAVARDVFAQAMAGDGPVSLVEGLEKPRELWEQHAKTSPTKPAALDELVKKARRGEGQALFDAIGAIKQTANSDDYPYVRGDLASDPIVGPLLKAQRPLTDDERRTVIEAVLTRGKIVDVSYRSKSTSAVYTVTFAEKLDGKPIQAIAKPERGSRSGIPTFARTVLQYQRDRLLGTGMVPPSVEGVMSFDGGKTREVCSLMYCLRDAKLVGEDMPAFQALQQTPAGDRQMRTFKLGLYLGDDLDHVPDGSGNYGDWFNSANTMIEATADGPALRHIDTEYSYGMPPIEIAANMLPPSVEGPVRARLDAIAPDEMKALAAEWAPDSAASEAKARWATAQSHFGRDLDLAKSAIEKRLSALPQIPGKPRGELLRVGNAYVQEIVGDGLRYGRALVVADPKTGKAHVVEGGFLQQYEGAIGRHRDHRLWLDSIDYGWKTTGAVPLEEAKVGKDGVRLQRFDGGYIVWDAAKNDLRVKNVEQLVAGARATHPAWGAVDAPFALFHGGFSAPMSGGALYLERGLCVVNPKTDGVHVVDGFLDAYTGAWADGQPGHAALGLPTSDQHEENGRQVQTFEHGSLTWSAAEGVLAHVDTDPYGR